MVDLKDESEVHQKARKYMQGERGQREKGKWLG